MNRHDNSCPTPDAWAARAAAWPLAFAQVREDPRLDVEIVRRVGRPAAVVMIASGGDTAVRLGRMGLERLTIVDINPAQLALAQMKWHLAQRRTAGEIAALLGHAAMGADERRERLAGLLSELKLERATFGSLDEVAGRGLDHAGRYELLFEELRRELLPEAETIARILHLRDPREAARLAASGTAFGDALDAALARVMSLANLVCLFGNEATQNPRQPFHVHFAQRIRHVFATLPAAENPFLWQLLGGRFPPGIVCDWLDGGTAPVGAPEWRSGPMHEVLATMDAESADVVHLSNILDWLSAEHAGLCLCNAARVLRPGGFVIVRQLNSTLDIPALRCGLRWDHTWGRELHAGDRSFFYTAIHVGRKP